MKRNQLISAGLVVLFAVVGVVYTVIAGNQPLLGLDLQGGVSVVLEPTRTGSQEITDESLDLTVELLRGRIDEIGVAEPEISRQGENIVVALPGVVEDQEQALDRLQQTAELRFRPVYPLLSAPASGTDAEGDAAEDAATDDGEADDGEADAGDGDGTSSTDSSDAGEDEESSLGVLTGRYAPVVAAQGDSDDDSDPGTEDNTPAADADADADAATDGTPADGDDESDAEAVPADQTTLTPGQLEYFEVCTATELTPDDDDLADRFVLLPSVTGEVLCLGPSLLTGETVESANVGLGLDGWEVNPVFRPGSEGIDQFNEAAGFCFRGDFEVCPSQRLAIVLDHQVISAPAIQAETFSRDQIRISGTFEEEEARLLAESLRFGSLPVELVAQETRTVSATIGQDILRSGVVAGLIGLALVAVYLLAYYRLAGLVAIAGLILSGGLLWTIVAWFGEFQGLALSLAGVVGLIVAIGVSADSNIVYFENVKESFASGRKIGTAVERAYQSSISTIVKADVVSLIAAVLLYVLTVGAVRGFAFYLGLATILDLIISWMFMRPALNFLAQRSAVQQNPGLVGLSRPAE